MTAPSAGSPSEPAAAVTHPCAGCGARVEYEPGTTTLVCPYCGRSQPLIPLQRKVTEHDFNDLANRPRARLAKFVVICPQCGATSDSDALAMRCQFCNAPVTVDPGAGNQIPPEAVLPFAIDRPAVRTALQQWVLTRSFAPTDFRRVSTAESLVGTYVPHWTYDADTDSDYDGERGDHYWVTEPYTTIVNGKTETQTRQVRHTRWSSASGTVSRSFDDVIVRASTRVAAEDQDKLEPWPLPEAVPFQPEYLSGYSALRYDVEPETGFESARSQMAEVIERDCEADIGGDEQRVHHVATRYTQVTYKLVLFPVWVVSYIYLGRPYRVIVNGRTAEVIGQRPYSRWKIAIAVLTAIALVTLIILAVVHGNQ